MTTNKRAINLSHKSTEIMKPIETEFTCIQCGLTKPIQKNGGTGYAENRNTGERTCYACCGLNDDKEFREAIPGQKIVQYLIKSSDGQWQITNWPGTLRINVTPKNGKHNIAGNRYDTWFTFADKDFHGVTFGDWTQIHHIKLVKK